MGGHLSFYIQTPQLLSDKRTRADMIDKVSAEPKNVRYWSLDDECNWSPDLV